MVACSRALGLHAAASWLSAAVAASAEALARALPAALTLNLFKRFASRALFRARLHGPVEGQALRMLPLGLLQPRSEGLGAVLGLTQLPQPGLMSKRILLHELARPCSLGESELTLFTAHVL